MVQIQRIGHTAQYPHKCFPFFTTRFHVRRLLKRTTASEQNYHTRNWDVCDTLPSRFDASIQAMNEQDFAGPRNTKERWIPNTGEFLLLNDVRLSGKNDAGALLQIVGAVSAEMEVS